MTQGIYPNYTGTAPLARDVLDHGFVALRNLAGPMRRNEPGLFDARDTDPANSARMSFGNMDSGRTEQQDLHLAEYLMKNRHLTPFEMIEVWVEMKMPIFVARQFVRHRTATINEISGRYVKLERHFYIPNPATVGVAAANKKQGRAEADAGTVQENFARRLAQQCDLSYDLYEESLEDGIPAELARCFLHVNHYTHWLWKQDLRNVFNFLSLRDHSHAQYEAQQYAKALDALIRDYLPHTMSIYDQYCRQE